VKVFTKFEDLPEELRKPDSGVKFEDGWIRDMKIGQTLYLPSELHMNYAVRLRSVRETKANNGEGIVVRRQEPSDSTKRGHYLGKYTVGKLLVQHVLNGKYQTLHSSSPSGAPIVGQEYTLELGVVGKRLVSRMHSTFATSELEPDYMEGRAYLSLLEPFHDIEVINLDGIPEAEALRILGVDEKGNDLRALAAKQEQQMAEQAKAVDALAAIPELKALHDQLTKLTAERVTAPFEVDVAKLNSGYLGGIDRKIAEERGKGNLDGILALEEEKKLVVASSGTRSQGPDGLRLPTEATTGAVPATDTETTPATLKGLRQIYRDTFAKLDASRAASLKALTDPLTLRLKQLESTLTQANRIPDAKVVREYREGLGRSTSFPTRDAVNGSVGTTTPSTPAGTDSKVRSTTKKFPPGDDRKAAEWVLSVGGSVKTQGIDKYIMNATDLPRGRFELSGVYLEFSSTNRPKGPIDDFLPLAGLKGLTRLNVKNVPTTNAHWEVLPSLPSLAAVLMERTGVTDAVFVQLAATDVKTIDLNYETSLTGQGIEALGASKKLEKLSFYNFLPTEEGLRQIGQLESLTYLALSGSGNKLKDEHLPLLAGLKKLDTLLVRHTAVTAEALASVKTWSGLTTLGFDMAPGTTAAQVALLAKAFPKLETLSIEGEASFNYAAEDVSALAGFTKLKAFTVTSCVIGDEALAGVLALPKLETLRFSNCAKVTDAALETFGRHKSLRALAFDSMPNITDAGLPHLVGLKSLSRLELLRCPNLTSDAIAAFQNARPDVTVTR